MISGAYLAVRSAGYQPAGTSEYHAASKRRQPEHGNGSAIQNKGTEEKNGASEGNELKHRLDDLGSKQIAAPSDHDSISSTPPEKVKSPDDNNTSGNLVSKFLKNNSVKYGWAGAYIGANGLRIGEGILDLAVTEVANSCSELAANLVVAKVIINVVRMAMVTILQIYDTASAELSGNELVKKEKDSKVSLDNLKKPEKKEVSLTHTAQTSSASTPYPAKKEDSAASSGKEENAQPDPKSSEKIKLLEDYWTESQAKNNMAAHTPAVGEAKVISGLVSAKETFFTTGAVVGLVKGVLALVKVVTLKAMVGVASAASIAVASVVLGVVSAVVGLAANLIDIYQGFAQRKKARQEIKEFSKRKNDFLKKTENAKSLESPIPSFKAGLSGFFDKKIASANIDEGYAVFRIIRGFVGLAISIVSTVSLIISGGSTAPIAGIIGGVTLVVYFGFIVLKIRREVLKVATEIEECNAAEDLKKAYPDINIFDDPANSKPGTENDRSENPFNNQYFLAWAVAKQFKTDVIEVDDRSKLARMNDLLKTIGFLQQDIDQLNLLKGSPNEAPKAMELLEKMVRSKLKITDRKPQQKEPAKSLQKEASETSALFREGVQTV